MAESERDGGPPGGGARAGGPSTSEHGGYARSAAREQAERARQRAREAGQQARETAGLKAAELKQQAERATDEFTSRVGGQAASLARALRRASEELRNDGEGRFAGLLDQGAGQVERIGAYLDGNKPDQMLADFERMARANPAFFVGGTFATGMLLGRFLRSSEPAAEVVFEPEGDWGLEGGPFPREEEARPAFEAPDPGLGEGPDLEAALTVEDVEPERAMTPDLENISDEHPSLPPIGGAREHLDEETPVHPAFPGHETVGPGIRTGSSGAAALDAGSAGPGHDGDDGQDGNEAPKPTPRRRRSDREGK